MSIEFSLTTKTYVPTNSAKAVRTISGIENLGRILNQGHWISNGQSYSAEVQTASEVESLKCKLLI